MPSYLYHSQVSGSVIANAHFPTTNLVASPVQLYSIHFILRLCILSLTFFYCDLQLIHLSKRIGSLISLIGPSRSCRFFSTAYLQAEI